MLHEFACGVAKRWLSDRLLFNVLTSAWLETKLRWARGEADDAELTAAQAAVESTELAAPLTRYWLGRGGHPTNTAVDVLRNALKEDPQEAAYASAGAGRLCARLTAETPRESMEKMLSEWRIQADALRVMFAACEVGEARASVQQESTLAQELSAFD
jgi:hypothetical protein